MESMVLKVVLGFALLIVAMICYVYCWCGVWLIRQSRKKAKRMPARLVVRCNGMTIIDTDTVHMERILAYTQEPITVKGTVTIEVRGD